MKEGNIFEFGEDLSSRAYEKRQPIRLSLAFTYVPIKGLILN